MVGHLVLAAAAPGLGVWTCVAVCGPAEGHHYHLHRHRDLRPVWLAFVSAAPSGSDNRNSPPP